MQLRNACGRAAPAVGLFFLAPFIAEFLLGDVAVNGLATLLVVAPMYGGGAVVVREVVRRSRRGWPSMLALGLAYGILEEGLVTQSLFNPDYAGLRLLDPAFIPALGIGAAWTVFVLSLHTVWSIGASIGLAEALAVRRDPARETTPWLGRRTLTVAAALFVAGSVAIGLGSAAGGFIASPPQLTGAALASAALVVVAVRMPRTALGKPSRSAPNPLVVLAVGLGLCAAFFIASSLPTRVGWPQVAIPAVVWACAAGLTRRWSRRPGWSRTHRSSLVAAAVLTYTWHGFTAEPVMATSFALRVTSSSLYAIIALGLLAVAWRGSQRHSESDSGLTPTRSDRPATEVARREQIPSLRGDGHLDR